MFFEIIKWSVISFILIVLIHYLFIFFKDNLTIPKTKDLVTKPLEKYKAMEIVINNNLNDTSMINNLNDTSMINDLNDTSMINNLVSNQNISNISGTTKLDTLNNEENMKDELKSFFTELNNL